VIKRILRILNGRLSFVRSMPLRWHWYGFGLKTYWGGRLVYMYVGVGAVVLDWRGDFLADMGTGDIK
jgi:hypothetical protein